MQRNHVSPNPARSRNPVGNPSLPAIGALLLSTVCAHAHPGHDWHNASVTHVLTSPDHLAVLTVAGLIMGSLGCSIHRRIPRRILRYGGALAIIVAVVLRGLGA